MVLSPSEPFPSNQFTPPSFFFTHKPIFQDRRKEREPATRFFLTPPYGCTLNFKTMDETKKSENLEGSPGGRPKPPTDSREIREFGRKKRGEESSDGKL